MASTSHKFKILRAVMIMHDGAVVKHTIQAGEVVKILC